MDERDQDPELDPGAYIGSEPELASEKLPEPLGPDDERVAAHSTQPEGRVDGDLSDPREAGQDR